MTDDRDFDLASALRTLPTPEHRPGFWDELEAELEREAAAPVHGRGGRRRPGGRRPFPGLGVLAVAAAAVLVVAAVVVLRPDPERRRTRVATDPPTTTPSTVAEPPGLPGLTGPPQSLGDGVVVGVTLDGSAALVVAGDPEAEGLGCEGTGVTALYAAPLDGGARRRTVSSGESVGGTVVRNPADPARVAIVSVCEEFLSSVVVAREEPGGTLSGAVAVDRDLLGDLGARFSWTRDGSALLGVVPATGDVVRLDPVAGTRQTVVAGRGAVHAGELADGSLAVLTRDQRLYLGEVVHSVAAVGIAVSPDGRHVAAYGDGVWLFTPGVAPRQLTTGFTTDLSWAPDGEALAVTAQGTPPGGGRLSVVSLGIGTLVLDSPGTVGAGHFSPDGRALAFTRLEPAGDGAFVERAMVARLE